MPETIYAVIPDTPPPGAEMWMNPHAPPSDAWMAKQKAASDAYWCWLYNIRLEAEYLSKFKWWADNFVNGRAMLGEAPLPPPSFDHCENGVPVASGPPICPRPPLPVLGPDDTAIRIGPPMRGYPGWFGVVHGDGNPTGFRAQYADGVNGVVERYHGFGGGSDGWWGPTSAQFDGQYAGRPPFTLPVAVKA